MIDFLRWLKKSLW